MKITLKELRNVLNIGEIYKYRKLCETFGEKPKRNDSKESQLKDWACYFRWENVTTQQMRIIEIYDTVHKRKDGRKNNGGARVGAGAKSKIKEEFDYLFNAFLRQELSRNSFYAKPNFNVAYFSNAKISKYFGLYSSLLYDGKDEDKYLFSKVYDCITIKRDNWIYSRIRKIKGVTLSYGIIAYKDRNNRKVFDYKDEYLEQWNKENEKYKEINEFENDSDVAKNDMWFDMIDYISGKFPEYDLVIKVRKIECPISILKEYNIDDMQKYRTSFNSKAADEIIKSLEKKSIDAKEFVNKYVRI